MRSDGIEPAPERDRHTRWSTFLKAHWECLAATDFLSVEVHTLKGLVTYYLLFFIDIASRSVHVAGRLWQQDSDFEIKYVFKKTAACWELIRVQDGAL